MSASRMESYFVYLLRCSDGSYYVGSTNDVEERVKRHNDGTASEWTKSRRPVALVYREEQDTLLFARRREEQIKGWSRRKKENLISGVWKRQ